MTTQHDDKTTISMQTVSYPDGSFGVNLYLTDLLSQEHAEAAMAHMERLFCGDEIKPQS